MATLADILMGRADTQTSGADGYADQSTADVLGQMDRMYAGPGGMLRSLRDQIPESPNALSILNMARGGLGTAANWLQGTPEIGPDTLAPLGLASMGTGAFNALTRAAPDVRIARALMQQFPDEVAIGKMHRTPMYTGVIPDGGGSMERGWARPQPAAGPRATFDAVSPKIDPEMMGAPANINARGPVSLSQLLSESY